MKSIITSLLIVVSFSSFAFKESQLTFEQNIQKRKELIQKIEDLEEEIEELEKSVLTESEIWLYEDEIAYLNNDNALLKRDIQELNTNSQNHHKDSLRLADFINNNKAEIKAMKDILDANIKNEESIKVKTNSLELYEQNLVDTELQINLALYENDHENKFKSILSWIFCGLVLIVIIGFFWLTYRKEEIARNIFSGDHGIQFITLFLLIISIILFGIMGILQGRELGALIGGISGYILGRSGGSILNGNKKDEEPQTANAEVPQAD